MVDRAFSHHSRKRETIFPNAYKEDLYRLNGYCKNVTTHTDRASWDFSLNMPKPTTFKNAWTGVAPEKPHNKGYDGPNENEWGDTDNGADDEADEKDVDDLNLAASSGPDAEDDDDAYEEYERGRSPTTRRCTNGLWRGCAGTREKYNQCKARAAMVILRCLHASSGIREWKEFRERVVICQRAARVWLARRAVDCGMNRGNDGGDDDYPLMAEDEIQETLRGVIRIVVEEELRGETEKGRVIAIMTGRSRYFCGKSGFDMSE